MPPPSSGPVHPGLASATPDSAEHSSAPGSTQVPSGSVATCPQAEEQRGRHPFPPTLASRLRLFLADLLLGGGQPERNGEDEGAVPARDHGEAEEPHQPHQVPGQHLGLQRCWRRAQE